MGSSKGVSSMKERSPGIESRRRIMEAVRQFWRTKHTGPSLTELQDMTGIERTTVGYHVNILIERGELVRVEAATNSLQLPGMKFTFEQPGKEGDDEDNNIVE